MLANRLVGVLAWVGAFIAGVLTYGHFAGKGVPCGGSGGCDTVARHPAAYWFGIPVALIGLAGYIVLALLSAARPLGGRAKWRRLVNLSTLGTAFGFIASVYFMYTSFAVIEAKCVWCIASAVTMTVLLIATGWLWSCDDPEVAPAKWDSFSQIGALILALGAFGFTTTKMNEDIDRLPPPTIGSLTVEEILPSAAKVRGPKEAPVIVVEFADFNCPSCRATAPVMDAIFAKYREKIRWGFRHVPLVKIPGHETSMHAATLSELAARKGRFWDFFDSAFAEENTERVKSFDGIRQVAMDMGLSAIEIDNALDRDSEEAQSVIADMDMALRLNISSTPVFLILAPGLDPKVVTGRRLASVFEEKEYKNILER